MPPSPRHDRPIAGRRVLLDYRFFTTAEVLMVQKVVASLVLSGLALLVGCGSTIQGSGTIVTDQRDIPDLQRVSVCCGFEVELAEGSEPSLALTGDDNIVEAIEVRRVGETIRVDFADRHASYRPTQRPLVEVVLTDVQGFSGSGGVDLNAAAIETDALEVVTSGGSDADFARVTADRLDLNCSGGGSVDIEGDVDRQVIQLSGGSSYEARRLQSRRAELRLSGGSRAKVTVSERLKITASGGSSVSFQGKPNVEANTSGGSSVMRQKN
jgi:hypothetical protein